MSYEIEADYDQQYLFPPSVEDWIDASHPARFVREFVNSLDVESVGFKLNEGGQGRPYYGVKLLLSVWLYGYMEKIRSTRGLEKACYNHFGFIWLAGNHRPDHNTLWRFFKDNKSALKGVFRNTVLTAMDCGMVGFDLQAVDGTKIQADASKASGLHERDLKKLITRVDAQIEEMIGQIDQSQANEAGSYGLRKDLQDKKQLRSEIDKSLSKLQAHNTKHLSHTDKDCRMMKGRDGTKFSYNAQVVVDDQAQIIVAADVSNARNDSDLLTPMLDQVNQVCGQTATYNLADGGYFSGKQLDQARNNNYEVLMNLPKAQKPSSDPLDRYRSIHFEYDDQQDVYVCPEDKILAFSGIVHQKNRGYDVRLYRCNQARSCVVGSLCTKDKRSRVIRRIPYSDAIHAQRIKQADERNRKLLKRRSRIVEPVFGWIKHNQGFRRFNVRGSDNVNAQWQLVCAATNLKRIYRRWLDCVQQVEVLPLPKKLIAPMDAHALAA